VGEDDGALVGRRVASHRHQVKAGRGVLKNETIDKSPRLESISDHRHAAELPPKNVFSAA
jgi:hypothetical protein